MKNCEQIVAMTMTVVSIAGCADTADALQNRAAHCVVFECGVAFGLKSGSRAHDVGQIERTTIGEKTSSAAKRNETSAIRKDIFDLCMKTIDAM